MSNKNRNRAISKCVRYFFETAAASCNTLWQAAAGCGGDAQY
jgi:hypothetical protein